jgi:hypothetical protein
MVFDWGLWLSLSAMFWGAMRLQMLGLVNPQHAHRLWIALALAIATAVGIGMSVYTWQACGEVWLPLLTLVAAYPTGLFLAMMFKGPIPAYFLAAGCGVAAYVWRASELFG